MAKITIKICDLPNGDIRVTVKSDPPFPGPAAAVDRKVTAAQDAALTMVQAYGILGSQLRTVIEELGKDTEGTKAINAFASAVRKEGYFSPEQRLIRCDDRKLEPKKKTKKKK